MKTRELTLAIFGVIILSFFGYWAFSGVPATLQSSGNAEKQTDNSNYNPNAYNGKIQTGTTPIATSSETTNITDFIAQNLSNSFISNANNNPSSLGSSSISMSPQDLQTALSQLPKDFNKVPSDSELNISDDSSVAARKDYLLKAFNMIVGNFSTLPSGFGDKLITNIFEKNDTALAQQVLDITNKTIDDLEKLEVPRAELSLHKKAITGLNNSAIAYNALINYKNDPFRLLAMESYLGDMGGQVVSLSDSFLEEWVKVK